MGRGWIIVLAASWSFGQGSIGSAPTFYHDVLPILQRRCQQCHRPEGSAPMPLVTYDQVRPWAKAIREAVASRKMPPWFADPCCGHFSNDRSLTSHEINILTHWNGAAGDAADAPGLPSPDVWPATDATLAIRPFNVPAKGAVDYQYFAVPTGFEQDRWVRSVAVHPGSPRVVHHVVVYIREPGSTWNPSQTKHGPTKADILQVWAPGTSPEIWPEGMAKLIPARSDLVFEIHYTPNGKAAIDRTSVSIGFAKSPPAKRVLTLQMGNDRFAIPPGDPNYRVTVWGTIPNDALLLGFFPHMHLRGKAFEFDRIREDGQPDVMLRVSHYDFYWQLAYRLAVPIPLKKGTRLEWIAWFDNSANNPRNPDPSAEVRYGQQSWEEMMIGFFDVAVDASVNKADFFIR
jgi:hypothetical protein